MKDALRNFACICAVLVFCSASSAWAGDARIVDAKANFANESGDMEIWSFDVTVEHADEGWDHYADAFEILTTDGVVLGVRTLYHPHVDEQPFTRSLTGVEIPKGTEVVVIRAHDSVHGYGETHMELELARPE